jgi:hypothetical protein
MIYCPLCGVAPGPRPSQKEVVECRCTTLDVYGGVVRFGWYGKGILSMALGGGPTRASYVGPDRNHGDAVRSVEDAICEIIERSVIES